MEIEIIGYDRNYVEFLFTGSFSVNRVYRYRNGVTKPYPLHNKIYNIIKKKYSDIIALEYDKYDKFNVHYNFIFNTNQKRDVSNYIKVFEDLVFRYFIKVDDSRVYRMTATKSVIKSFPSNYLKISWSSINDEEIEKNKIEAIKESSEKINKIKKQKKENKKTKKNKN